MNMLKFKNETKADVLVYATREGYTRLAPGQSVEYPADFPFMTKEAPPLPKEKTSGKKK